MGRGDRRLSNKKKQHISRTKKKERAKRRALRVREERKAAK